MKREEGKYKNKPKKDGCVTCVGVGVCICVCCVQWWGEMRGYNYFRLKIKERKQKQNKECSNY